MYEKWLFGIFKAKFFKKPSLDFAKINFFLIYSPCSLNPKRCYPWSSFFCGWLNVKNTLFSQKQNLTPDKLCGLLEFFKNILQGPYIVQKEPISFLGHRDLRLWPFFPTSRVTFRMDTHIPHLSIQAQKLCPWHFLFDHNHWINSPSHKFI